MEKLLRKHQLLPLMIVFLLLSVSFTSAYNVSRQKIENYIVFGDLKLKLIENTIDENGNEIVFDNSAVDVSKTENVSRIVKVENVCDNDMFVRIKLDVTSKNNNDETISLNDHVSFDINNSDWLYKDGYYYYHKILKAGKTTEDLFDNISFDSNAIIADSYNGEVKLDINVEAVQSKNNGDDVLKAEGWPK